jgi:hypothetical protein
LTKIDVNQSKKLKKLEMGILIICAKIMTVQSCQNFVKNYFTLHNFIKNEYFWVSKNKNWRSNICPPTGYSQFLSLDFEKFAVPIEKVPFFKKAKKSKFLNSVENEEKQFRKKVLLRSFYMHWENQCRNFNFLAFKGEAVGSI